MEKDVEYNEGSGTRHGDVVGHALGGRLVPIVPTCRCMDFEINAKDYLRTISLSSWHFLDSSEYEITIRRYLCKLKLSATDDAVPTCRRMDLQIGTRLRVIAYSIAQLEDIRRTNICERVVSGTFTFISNGWCSPLLFRSTLLERISATLPR